MNATLSPQTPAPSRRSVLTNSVLAAGTAALLAPTAAWARAARPAAATITFADIPGAGDIKVLNYALALEDLEADLYKQALARLTGGGVTSTGVAIKGLNVPAAQPDIVYAKQFAAVEQQHATFLRSAITAAGGPVLPLYRHDFGIQNMNRRQVDDLVLKAEQLGVMAYLGAIPFFSDDDSPYVAPAAAILGTEARHAAVLASILNVMFRESNIVAPLANQNQGRDTPLAPDAVLAQVSPFIVP